MKPLPERITVAVRTFEAELERAGWDAPPSLHMLFADEIGRVRVGMQLLPEAAQRLQRPHQAMAELARVLPGEMERGRYEVPGEWRGWLFAHEAWMVTAEPAVQAEVFAAADRRQPHVHPARREVRVVMARDLDGRDYTVHRERGQAPLKETRWALDGDVPRCLTVLTEATRATAGRTR